MRRCLVNGLAAGLLLLATGSIRADHMFFGEQLDPFVIRATVPYQGADSFFDVFIHYREEYVTGTAGQTLDLHDPSLPIFNNVGDGPDFDLLFGARWTVNGVAHAPTFDLPTDPPDSDGLYQFQLGFPNGSFFDVFFDFDPTPDSFDVVDPAMDPAGFPGSKLFLLGYGPGDPPFTIMLTGPTTSPQILLFTINPEPGTLTLAGMGLACLAGYGWRRRQRQLTNPA